MRYSYRPHQNNDRPKGLSFIKMRKIHPVEVKSSCKSNVLLLNVSCVHSYSHALCHSLYTIIWCLCSALYVVVLKLLLQSFPYPLCITGAVLGTQFVYSLSKWFLFRKQRAPSFSRLKRRHWQRLLPAALSHGLGTIASHYTAQSGPMSTCILLKLLPYPFLFQSIPILLGVGVSVTSVLQLAIGMTANLLFAARSRVRISTHRFQGGQNVFEVTCALSFVLVVVPLALLVEGIPDMTRHYVWLLLLGVLYSVSNDMGAAAPQHDSIRRIVTWTAAVTLLGEARRYQDVIGAVLVFCGRWWRTRSQTKTKKNQDLPSVTRNRAFSAESFATQGTASSLRSIRSLGSAGAK